MRLFVLTVPIMNWDNTDIFDLQVYAQSEHPPEKTQWESLISRLHDAEKDHMTYTGTWQEALNSLKESNGFPVLYGNLVVRSVQTKIHVSDGRILSGTISLQELFPEKI